MTDKSVKGSYRSKRNVMVYPGSKVLYNPTIINTRFRSSHGVHCDSGSDRMEIDLKLRR